MITLTSDFGSPYPAAMKAVILGRTDARMIDIGHDFPRQDVRTTAFWLRELLPWFPPAVHLVVVDPGVGTDRTALVLRAGDHALVGPDNGVLVPAARRLASAPDTDHTDGGRDPEAFEITIDDPESSTFHGRDVFAPVAADIHAVGIDGLDALDQLESTASFEPLSFPDPVVDADGVTGEVLVVDGFGNAITNIPGDVLADRFGDFITVNGDRIPVRRAYAAVESDDRLVTVGSHGNVELAVNRGRGTRAFGVEPGSTVRLSW